MNKEELINLLRTNSFWAKKSMGQNFLVNDEALQKIVEAAELKKDDFVIEIGPGFGILTEELIGEAGEVLAIEKDDELAEYLNLKFKDQGLKLKVLNDDILRVNIPELVGKRKYKVVANIPYYITSKIIRLFLEQKSKPEQIVLLVQKEVAERICAPSGEMSVLSVSVQYYGNPEIIDIVTANSFFPMPKVDSAILRISNIIDQGPDEVEEKNFFRLVNIGFASRRKTLLNNLMSGYHLDRKKLSDILKLTNLSENVRAQELSIEEWKKLARLVSCI